MDKRRERICIKLGCGNVLVRFYRNVQLLLIISVFRHLFFKFPAKCLQSKKIFVYISCKKQKTKHCLHFHSLAYFLLPSISISVAVAFEYENASWIYLPATTFITLIVVGCAIGCEDVEFVMECFWWCFDFTFPFVLFCKCVW